MNVYLFVTTFIEILSKNLIVSEIYYYGVINFSQQFYLFMKRISNEEVKKVAALARLELNNNQIDNHAKQLEKILEYINQLDKINTDNVTCTTRAIEVINVLRKDEKKDNKNVEEFLDLAPSRENKFYKVPKIMNE